jgi:hypothetical protein
MLLAFLALAAGVLLVAGLVVWAVRSSRPRLDAGSSQAAQRTVPVGPGRGFWFDIVGESNYQGTLRRIDGGRLAEEQEVIATCFVVAEPGNKFDPNALAVHAQGFGKVGYFDRDSASYTFANLGQILRDQNAVGVCEGRLTGGWTSDVSIGVRLSILPPESFGPGGVRALVEPAEQRRLVCDAPDWETRPRMGLPVGRGKGLALTQEYLCQEELLRVCDGRDPSQETVVFQAVIVADATGGAIVCADGGAPVGRFSKTDSERYQSALAELAAAGVVGATDGWVVPERAGLGVRLSIATPAALAAHFKASAARM